MLFWPFFLYLVRHFGESTGETISILFLAVDVYRAF